MRKNRKLFLISLVSVILAAIPAYAVFQEKTLPRTLDVLHFELKMAYEDLLKTRENIPRREGEQHKNLIKLIKDCNELSIMLYSQQQDYTFDLTYALNKVTDQYLNFNKTSTPYNEIVSRLEIEIDRYDKLVRTLKNLPPVIRDKKKEEVVIVASDDSLSSILDTLLLAAPSFMDEPEARPFMLDSVGCALRDSCLFYAQLIEDLYWEDLIRVDEDNMYYVETDKHLKDSYTYAQARYKSVQKKIFVDGQTDYLTILRTLGTAWESAMEACSDKYSTTAHKQNIVSEWRGPMVVGFAAIVFFYIFLSFLISNVVVRILLKKVKTFQKPYYQDHKTTFILLLGTVLFALTIMAISLLAKDNNFVSMAAPLLAEVAWLMAAIFTSILIRLRQDQASKAITGYTPIIMMAIVIICIRIIFVPNSLMNIIFPPLLLFFCVWQIFVNRKAFRSIPTSDKIYMWATFFILGVATVMSWMGYVMLALLVTIWWIFQLTVLQTIAAVSFLLSKYYENTLSERKRKYRANHLEIPFKHTGAYIEISWGYDLLNMAIVPIATLWSIPLCIYMASGVFDLSNSTMQFFYSPLTVIEKFMSISLVKVVVIATLFYLFKFITYAVKAFYRLWRTRSAAKTLDKGVVFKDTTINFTLSDNVTSLICWGIFLLVSFAMLRIPTSAITIISTGLATGIGFAMKDVLNNFFYGIQLMSGRLRVGDVIECDGIRGSVDSMSYQSTQILSIDGAIIAIPNSSLFSKNFKNLTRNHAYELLKIPVGVKYGTDVEKVRQIIVDALQVLQVKDKYGRDIVDPKNGIIVRFQGFGDNSVDLIVQQYTTVESHFTYAAKAKEIIYNALNENGIEIPFPQRDLYIKQVPEMPAAEQTE